MKTTKRLIFLATFWAVGWLLTTSELLAQQNKPNVIVIMTDDQGYGDFGFTGNDVLKTPNLDRLAKQSAHLTRFYVSPVCTPTRSALMTGRYPQRTGAYDTYLGRAMMSPKETTVAELLKGSGYRTGIFGKWHLGDCYPMRPSDQGFDESLIHLGGGLAQPSDPIENGNRYTDPILFHNDKKEKVEGYCTDIFFSKAMDFMVTAKKREQPFFTYIATNAPHGPFHDVPSKSLERYKGKTANDKTDRIFAMIDNVDENVGRLMEFLDQEKLSDNTIVLFLTDNGPNTQRYVGPFRGRKGRVYEGGIRTVLLARWPNRFQPGHKNGTAAAHIDLLPTLVEATGTKLPEALKLDGRSVLPLLKGSTPTNWPTDRPLVFQWHRGEPVRGRGFAIVSGPWKLLNTKSKDKGDLGELYNIHEDPKEQRDLTGKHPDIVAKLWRDYDAWYDSLNDGEPVQYVPRPIEIGSSNERTTRFTKQDWLRTAGTGWGSLGLWHIQSKHRKKYQATIILQRATKAKLAVVLRIGKKEHQGEIPPGQRQYTFPVLEVKPGGYTLEVSTKDKRPIPGFYQLHLKQQ